MVIWCNPQFGFIAFSDSYSTGSSIMPQKRNPDAAELVRAKSGPISGDFLALNTVLKGLPLAYDKDLQEDKPPVFHAFDALDLAIRAMTGMILDFRANTARMAAVAAAGFSTATDLADWLVQNLKIPFREAHHIAGAAGEAGRDQGGGAVPADPQTVSGPPSRHHRRHLPRPYRPGLLRGPHLLWRICASSQVRLQAARWRGLLAAKG